MFLYMFSYCPIHSLKKKKFWKSQVTALNRKITHSQTNINKRFNFDKK